MTLVDIALIAYILIFALLATVAGLANVPVRWGRTSAGAYMSRRSKIIFVATAWSSVGMIAGAMLQHPPLAGLGTSGFFFGVILCLLSGMIDHWQARR